MALSNIFREPRREITESLVGLAIVGGFLYLDYHAAVWFHEWSAVALYPSAGGCPVLLGMALGVAAIFIVMALLSLTHAIGDSICNVLQTRGLHLRPRQRRG